MNWINEVLKFGASQVFTVEDVEDSEKNIRLAICEGCKNFDPAGRKCLVCGCFMDVKAGTKIHRNVAKLRYEVTHCPDGKWMDVDLANSYRQIDNKDLIIIE